MISRVRAERLIEELMELAEQAHRLAQREALALLDGTDMVGPRAAHRAKRHHHAAEALGRSDAYRHAARRVKDAIEEA